MMSRDPFQYSLMAQPAYARLLAVVGVLLCLWIAIAWAVALPWTKPVIKLDDVTVAYARHPRCIMSRARFGKGA